MFNRTCEHYACNAVSSYWRGALMYIGKQLHRHDDLYIQGKLPMDPKDPIIQLNSAWAYIHLCRKTSRYLCRDRSEYVNRCVLLSRRACRPIKSSPVKQDTLLGLMCVRCGCSRPLYALYNAPLAVLYTCTHPTAVHH